MNNAFTLILKAKRNWLLIALGFVTSALILLAMGFALVGGQPQKTRILTTLARYVLEGRTSSALMLDPSDSFRLSRAILDLSGEKTLGDVLDDLNRLGKQVASEPRTVEVRLPFSRYIEQLLTRLAAPTRFKGKVVVNHLPPQGHLGVFFLSSDPAGLLPSFNENSCAYLVGTSIIVCNAITVNRTLKLLDDLTTEFATTIGTQDPDGSLRVRSAGNMMIVRQLLKQNYLVWLLGHELGHAELHSQAAVPQALHFDLRYDDYEREADEFVVRAATGDVAVRAAFPVLLLEFIEQQFQLYFAEQHGSQTKLIPALDLPKAPIVLVAPLQGVPLILRAMRILERTLDADEHALERATYVVLDDKIAYVSSLKSAANYHFLKKKVVLTPSLTQQSFALPRLLLGGSFLAAVLMGGLIHRQFKRRSV